jgi:hypothetical protein
VKCLCLIAGSFLLSVLLASAAPKVDESQRKALEVLRGQMATNQPPQGARPAPMRVKGSTNQAPTLISAKEPLSYAEMERLFLTGKISQKQYQQYLKNYPVDPRKPQTPTAKTEPVLVPKVAPSPSLAVPPETAVEGTKKADDVEAQIEAIIRQKKARDEALKNAPPDPEPKTKREKLNAILKLYINEKITEEEYTKRRDKIMAEPED